jgi:hypothetical protein
MAVDCERPRRVVVEIGALPGRFLFGRALGRVQRAPHPSRSVAAPRRVCARFRDLVVERFPVEIDALRVYFTPDGVLPDLVLAFDPPLVLADGDVLEPTVPADLPAGCRSLPGTGWARQPPSFVPTCWSPLPTSSSFTPGVGDGAPSVVSLVGGAVGSVVWTVGSRVGVSDAVVGVTVDGVTVVVRGTGTVVGMVETVAVVVFTVVGPVVGPGVVAWLVGVVGVALTDGVCAVVRWAVAVGTCVNREASVATVPGVTMVVFGEVGTGSFRDGAAVAFVVAARVVVVVGIVT